MPHLTPTSLKYRELSIDMPKYLANNNRKDSLNTQSGTTPSNYYWAHQHHSREDFYVSHRTKSKKYQKLWQNTYKGEPFDRVSGHMLQMSFLSKRKMENCAQYKTTVLSINGQRKTTMYLL